MYFYKQLVIKILERSLVGSDNLLLQKLKRGQDLTKAEERALEELIDSII